MINSNILAVFWKFWAVCETMTYMGFLLLMKKLDILEFLLLMKSNDKLNFFACL